MEMIPETGRDFTLVNKPSTESIHSCVCCNEVHTYESNADGIVGSRLVRIDLWNWYI